MEGACLPHSTHNRVHADMYRACNRERMHTRIKADSCLHCVLASLTCSHRHMRTFTIGMGAHRG